MIRRLILFALIACAAYAGPAAAEDKRLIGTWKAVTYLIDGKTVPMNGLLIFTPGHYATAVRFKLAPGPHDDSNGNSGPYTADGKRVVFKQWVQIHLRPASKTEPILSHEGPDEATDYRIDGNRLTLIFPSKNEYILERIVE